MSLAFIGSKELGLGCLKSLVENNIDIDLIVTLDDTKDTRSCFEEFKLLADKTKIDLSVNPDKDSLEKEIKSRGINIILVCNWYKLIKEGVLKLVQKGVYGIHNSLLPKYRGMSPLIWSALSEDKYLGATLFKFDEGMDTGDIVKQWKIKNDDLYISEILDALTSQILKDLPKIVNQLIYNKATLKEQDHKEATYCNKRTPEDSLLPWKDINSTDALKFIKILNSPYPMNFSFIENRKISILKAKVFESPLKGIPGSLFQLNGKTVVSCSDNKGVELLEVIDEEGKKINLKDLKGRFSN